MDYEIYNAGDPIEEAIKFSLNSDKTDHATGQWPYRLESKEFKSIPTELELANDSVLRVEFPFDIIRKFGDRGVVLILSEKEKQRRFGSAPIPEHQPYATTKQDAKIRGDKLWYEYTYQIAQNYLNESMEARSKGGVLRKAQGFTARCLKLHNIIDPSDEMYLRATAGAGASEGLRNQVDQLQKQVTELLQQLQAPAATSSATAGPSEPSSAAPDPGPDPVPVRARGRG